MPETVTVSIKDQIQSQLNKLVDLDLYPEERAVLQAIYAATFGTDPQAKITQRQIADSEQWLGCHPKYDPMIPEKDRETTLRKVRQVIRDLRINRAAPILSDSKGYWIPTNQNEITEYLKRIEQEAKSQAAAWFQTYKVMSQSFQITSEYFEGQKSLFPTEEPEVKPEPFDAQKVRSQTDPEKTYKIIMTPEGPKCFCPGFFYRKTCKHIIK